MSAPRPGFFARLASVLRPSGVRSDVPATAAGREHDQSASMSASLLDSVLAQVIPGGRDRFLNADELLAVANVAPDLLLGQVHYAALDFLFEGDIEAVAIHFTGLLQEHCQRQHTRNGRPCRWLHGVVPDSVLAVRKHYSDRTSQRSS